MRERGQVFTLDMFFALALTALVLSYSGLALEQAHRQAEEYALRYSLERTANDAADVLVKTLGKPSNWANNPETLKALGIAEENQGNPFQNTVDVTKLGQFRRLTNNDNWTAPANADAVQAIRELFGDSDNFEVKVIYKELLARAPLAGLDLEIDTTLFGVEVDIEADNEGAEIEVDVELEWDTEVNTETRRAQTFTMVVTGGGLTIEVIVRGGVIEIWYKTTLWDIWPGWDVEASSGVENSLEVVVAKRSVVTSYGDSKYDSGTVQKAAGGRVEYPQDNFVVGSGELDTYDWYLLLLTSDATGLPVDVYINSSPPGPSTHRFTPPYQPRGDIWPDEHGGMDSYLHEGTNTVQIVSFGKPDTWLRLYILAVPACSSPDQVGLAVERFPATLEVKLWR